MRQAVAHAIDAEAIRAKVMRGFSKPVGSILVPGVQGYSADADRRLPYDREKARKLLAEAGYPDGFEVTLDAGNVQPAADIAQAVAAMLAQVGIKVRLNIVPQANYFPKIEKHDTSFYVLSWGAGVTADALYTMQALLHTPGKKGEGDFNLGRWSNAARGRDHRARCGSSGMRPGATPSRARRSSWPAQELPLVPIHQPLIPWAMRKNVSAWFSPVNTVYFYLVRME